MYHATRPLDTRGGKPASHHPAPYAHGSHASGRSPAKKIGGEFRLDLSRVFLFGRASPAATRRAASWRSRRRCRRAMILFSPAVTRHSGTAPTAPVATTIASPEMTPSHPSDLCSSPSGSPANAPPTCAIALTKPPADEPSAFGTTSREKRPRSTCTGKAKKPMSTYVAAAARGSARRRGAAATARAARCTCTPPGRAAPGRGGRRRRRRAASRRSRRTPSGRGSARRTTSAAPSTPRGTARPVGERRAHHREIAKVVERHQPERAVEQHLVLDRRAEVRRPRPLRALDPRPSPHAAAGRRRALVVDGERGRARRTPRASRRARGRAARR